MSDVEECPMMARMDVMARFAGGELVSLPGRLVAPGLAIIRLDETGEWAIIHIRSGLTVLSAMHEEAAAAIAFDLAAVDDWTRSAKELDAEGTDTVRQVLIRNLGIGAARTGPPACSSKELADLDAP